MELILDLIIASLFFLHLPSSTTHNIFHYVRSPRQGLFHNCTDGLGCFYTGPPFYHAIHRTVSNPKTAEVRTKVNVYTPSNPAIPQIVAMTNESIANTALNSSFPTKVIIHGYRVNLEIGSPVFKMKDELMKNGQYNVILVNWTESNKPPYYQAVANAGAVGGLVAKLLNFHVNHKGVNPRDIHIIGHSLGGQMAGWIGQRIPNLGRITGLDPAGPYFQDEEKDARLDETDAEFVDVIHSNGGSYGIGAAIGHMDFFPNGGRSQPGCRNINHNITKHDFLAGAFISDSCSHSRAVDYFTASINECQFLSLQCSSYLKFKNGECTNETAPAVMGFHAKKPEDTNEKKLFFLETTDNAPYCEKPV